MLFGLIMITFCSSENLTEGVNAQIRTSKFTHVIQQKILGMRIWILYKNSTAVLLHLLTNHFSITLTAMTNLHIYKNKE
jgi:hypothetical protein